MRKKEMLKGKDYIHQIDLEELHTFGAEGDGTMLALRIHFHNRICPWLNPPWLEKQNFLCKR